MPTWLSSLDWIRALGVGLPETAALAAVALIGYLFGHRTRKSDLAALDAQRLRELDRASGIARQLEMIAHALRQDLAGHHHKLARFRRRLNEAQEAPNDKAWHSLCNEAESILTPTMQLAEQLSLAYDAIRQQSDALETFTQARTDSLTGVGNGRALADKLDVLLTSARRNGADFCVAMVSLDAEAHAAPSDAEQKKPQLQELARLIQSCMRGSDFVARYGDEEFVVLMPQTRLPGASVFGERLRSAVHERMSETVSCGIAEHQRDDDERTLLGRADSAYYSAKAAGGNRQFLHNGSQIREHRPGGAARGAERAVQTASAPPVDAPQDVPTAEAEPTSVG